MANMNEIELTPEQQKELREICERAIEFVNNLYDEFVEIAQKIMERIREIAVNFGRMFLKYQLLEWKLPYRIADYISENIYWYWAVRLGFNWFHRKLLMI